MQRLTRRGQGRTAAARTTAKPGHAARLKVVAQGRRITLSITLKRVPNINLDRTRAWDRDQNPASTGGGPACRQRAARAVPARGPTCLTRCGR